MRRQRGFSQNRENGRYPNARNREASGFRFLCSLNLAACGLLPLALALSGCVTKATAQAQARAAFLAGQQQALERMQQTQARGPSVTFVGEVKNNLVPWTAGLTLARGIVAAEYCGSGDPKEIVITRDGQQIRIEAKQLLSGNDVPLQPRDVVEIRR